MNPTPADYTIPINQHWKRLQLVFVIFFCLLMAGLYVWTQSNPYLRNGPGLGSLWFWMALLFLGPVLLGVYFRQKLVVFSVSDQAVYIQTPLGRKRVMGFADVETVKPYMSSLGSTYFGLYRRGDRYERDPARISPFFSNRAGSWSAYQQFESTDLPRIRAILRTDEAHATMAKSRLSDEGLVYYAHDGDRYVLKSTYSRDSKKARATAVLLAGALIILITPSLRLQYVNTGIGLGLSGLIIGFLLTERKYVQRGIFVSEFWNGLFRTEYPLIQFSRFQITHIRVNLMNAGTNVNVVFRQGSGQKEVMLSHVRKTETIDALIQETKYVFDEMR